MIIFPSTHRLGRLWGVFLLIAAVLMLGTFALSICTLVALLRVQQNPAVLFQPTTRADSASQRLPTPAGIYLENGGLVVRLDLVTGIVRWAYRLNITQAPDTQLTNADSIVSVANNTVYVEVRDGHVHALEASTGRLRWISDLGERLNVTRTSKAISVGNELYVPGLGRMYVLNITDGHIMRSIATPDLSEFVLTGNELYTTSGRLLQTYHLPEGKPGWSAQADDDELFTQPRVYDGVLYVAAYSEARQASSLYAFALNTGQQLWHSGPEPGKIRDVTIGNDTIYAGASTGSVYAFDAVHGKLLWRSKNVGFVGKAPQVNGSALYITGDAMPDAAGIARAQSVQCLDVRTGTTRWTYTPRPAVVVDSVNVRNGKIYVDRENGIDVLNEQGGVLWSARSRGGAQYTAIEIVL